MSLFKQAGEGEEETWRGFYFNYLQRFLHRSLITLEITLKGFMGASGLMCISLLLLLPYRRRARLKRTIICTGFT